MTRGGIMYPTVKEYDRDYSREYSEEKLWAKITKFAAQAGRELIHKALLLYYATTRPDTPTWAKAVILGALGYFISPLDAIPDMIPVIGFTDDLSVLAAAVTTVAMYIDDEVRDQAERKLRQWFG
jgi:uncharacterized membrane protein YkvA (DUF1232 family)